MNIQAGSPTESLVRAESPFLVDALDPFVVTTPKKSHLEEKKAADCGVVLFTRDEPPVLSRPRSILVYKKNDYSVKKGFWQHGLLFGISHLFFYTFLEKEKKAYLDILYKAVAHSYSHSTPLLFEELADDILAKEAETTVSFLEIVEQHRTHMEHALSYDLNLERLLLFYARKNARQETAVLEHLVEHMAGSCEIEKVASLVLHSKIHLSPNTVLEDGFFKPIEKLLDLVHVHPFFQEFKAYFTDVDTASQKILKALYSHIKHKQEEWLELQKRAFFFCRDPYLEEKERNLKVLFQAFDFHVLLVASSCSQGKKQLEYIITHFLECCVTNFVETYAFVEKHKNVLSRLLRSQEDLLHRVLGVERTNKIQAILSCSSTLCREDIKCVLSLMQFLTQAKKALTKEMIAAFFREEITSLKGEKESFETHQRKYMKLIMCHSQVIVEYLKHTLSKAQFSLLFQEIIYHTAVAFKPLFAITWDSYEVDFRANFFLRHCNAQSFFEALTGERKESFETVWGSLNTQGVIAIAKRRAEESPLLLDVSLGE